MGFARTEFLAISARELALLFQEQAAIRRESCWHEAFLCTLLANMCRPEDRAPYSLNDFLPATLNQPPQQEQEPPGDMHAFIDALQRGETFQQSPEDAAAFKASMKAYLGQAEGLGKVTIVGPRGKPEPAGSSG